MSCNALAIKPSNEITNVTLALLAKVAELIPSTPYFINNEAGKKDVHVHLVKSTDWNEFPFFGQEQLPLIPAIAFGVPMVSWATGGYNTMSKTEYSGETPDYAIIVDPPIHIDLTYEYKIVAEDTIALQNIMVNFIRAIRGKLAEIEVYDRENDLTRTYDVDLEEYPDGSASTPTVDNIYQAKGNLKIKGVEITSGEYETYRTINSVCVIGVRIDERVSADVNMSGDIILTIE